MTLKRWVAGFFFSLLIAPWSVAAAQKTATPTDPLNRTSPRSAVTGFLEACQKKDYAIASQYLDLQTIPKNERVERGERLAQELETILNSDSSFSPLRLSDNPQGNPDDDTDPSIEHVSTVKRNGRELTLDLHRNTAGGGLEIWQFSAATVAAIPSLAAATPQSSIASRLPRFFSTIAFLGTPLWKWIVLLGLALSIIVGFRLVARILNSVARKVEERFHRNGSWLWLRSVLEPVLVFLCVVLFAIVERWIEPSAFSRLYIGRVLLLVVVSSIAWGVINLVDLFLRRLNSLLDDRQRVVSHSLLFLGRRLARALVVIAAAIIILSNWGYDMTTIIAGLGVGGIAVALAAQQTIANIFGGVSVIGDNPVMVGDFGNFGGVIGTVEDIGMRSTRVRTLSRTLVSVPNGSFAGMNLENYSVRDKILFNPTIQVKRTTPKDQIKNGMFLLHEMLTKHKDVEVGPTPVRLHTYTAASFGIELFAYVLTNDINKFYEIEAELFLQLDDVISSSGMELI